MTSREHLIDEAVRATVARRADVAQKGETGRPKPWWEPMCNVYWPGSGDLDPECITGILEDWAREICAHFGVMASEPDTPQAMYYETEVARWKSKPRGLFDFG